MKHPKREHKKDKKNRKEFAIKFAKVAIAVTAVSPLLMGLGCHYGCPNSKRISALMTNKIKQLV